MSEPMSDELSTFSRTAHLLLQYRRVLKGTYDVDVDDVSILALALKELEELQRIKPMYEKAAADVSKLQQERLRIEAGIRNLLPDEEPPPPPPPPPSVTYPPTPEHIKEDDNELGYAAR